MTSRVESSRLILSDERERDFSFVRSFVRSVCKLVHVDSGSRVGILSSGSIPVPQVPSKHLLFWASSLFLVFLNSFGHVSTVFLADCVLLPSSVCLEIAIALG